MMELPESHALAKQINAELTGKTITGVMLLKTPHRFCFCFGDTTEYPALLIGRSVTGAASRGGMTEIFAQDTSIVFGDGITPKLYDDIDMGPKDHQFALTFDDGTALICTVRMYGSINVCRAGENREKYYISSLTGENPMTDGFTYEYFRALYPAGRKLSAKAFLATEQRIPGIGNGVTQDILWDAGIDPRFKMDGASEEDFRALYASTVKVIKEMCLRGGRDTESDLHGRPGGYKTILSKNTLGKPCPRCSSPIKKAAYMGGTVYFCEECQKR